MSRGGILIVEDELIVARDIRERLLAMGYAVAGQAATGEDALAIAGREKPELVLMDIRIQGSMDGITAARKVREHFGIPVVFLTAYSEDVTLERAASVCPYGYILKPFDDRDLRSAIEIAVFRHDADARVRVSEERFASAFEHAAIGMALVSPEGRWLKVNRAICDILGYPEHELLEKTFQDITVPEDLEADLLFVHRMLRGEIASYQMEKRYRHKSGRIVWATLSVSLVHDARGEPLYFVSQVQDVTERKTAEDQSRMSMDVLNILNTVSDLHEAAGRLLAVIRSGTGIEAAAIRLADGMDFTYLAHAGFPAPFVAMENHLCSRNADGSVQCGPDGKPLLECTCGLVAEGRTDPSNPLFSPGGSAWTNDATARAGLTPAEDLRLHPRDQCLKEGYRSVALIPVREQARIIGLLQLNDRRPEQFSPQKIAFLEGLAASIGIAFSRRQTEERLREGVDKLTLSMDAAKAGIWEWNLRTNENIWSASLWGLYGLDPLRDEASYESWRKAIHPSDRPLAEKTVQTAAMSGLEFAVTWRVALPRDGVRWLMSRGRPLRDAEGSVARYIGVVIDVSEQRAATDKLQELRVALDQTTEGVAMSDLDGTITFVNKAWAVMHGSDAEALLGKPLSVFHTPAQMNAEVAPYLECLMAKGSHVGEVNHVRTDGSVFPTLMNTAVLMGTDGNPGGFLAFAMDITDRKRSEAKQLQLQTQLVEAQKMESIGRLAGGVAHDFNNNMFVVQGYADMALDAMGPASPLRQYVEQIRMAAQHAADVTQQLLAFSRKQILNSRPTDVDALIAKQQKILWRLLGENVKIHSNLGAAPGLAVVDPAQFYQVMMNLCINAGDSMPQGGELFIETAVVKAPGNVAASGIKAGAPFVRVSVIDRGSGMPPEIVARIFEPFFTTKSEGKGTGLGLSVVLGIVQQHGGWIAVESQPGKGSRFDVHFPVAEPGAKEEETARETAAPGNGELVLLVEDSAPVREIARQRLIALGYRVVAADGVENGWRSFQDAGGAVRVLFSDVVLADGSGLDLATRISAADSSVVVVLSSGYADERAQIQAIQDSRWAFLPKPYTRLQMQDLLHALLSPQAAAASSRSPV